MYRIIIVQVLSTGKQLCRDEGLRVELPGREEKVSTIR
jgi:hypothetical protein